MSLLPVTTKRAYKKRAGKPRGPYKKKKTYGNKRSMVLNGRRTAVSGPSPFPFVWKGCRQNYCELLAMTVGSSGLFNTSTIFALNDQFDPKFSVGGHQPYARDLLVQLYERYKVTHADVEVVFTSPSPGASLACAVQFANPTQIVSISGQSYGYVKEMPNTVVKLLNDTGTQKVTIKQRIPMWQVLGVTKLQFEADIGIYDALSGNSPGAAGKAYMKCAIADLNLGSSSSCNMTVNIKMVTDWYQRKILAQS